MTRPADSVLERLVAGRPGRPLTHLHRIPARDGRGVDWPDFVPELLRNRWAAMGVQRPWAHQAAAAELAHSGCSVVIATGTASGKSLAYQMPVLADLLGDPAARALYLSPTKALAGDQLGALRALALTGIGAATYDGDTPPGERDAVRRYSRLVLTNPDMLHRGILPSHARWAGFLRGLRYVVVDECHGYRGVFGSHVAHVLRRLRRICARYHVDPTFVLASATVSQPQVAGARLTGLAVRAVVEDSSPRGATSFALWEPPLLPGVTGENDAPVRRSATAEVGGLLADLVAGGVRTLAFVRSRRGSEVVALIARRHLREALGDAGEDAAARVAAYRAGYLPEERRELERALASGRLVGLASTNALELGIDIAGLDAVLLTGYPGTLASLWQQAGRAGRTGRDALAVLVARDDPLDTYLVHHPAAIFERTVEATVLDPDNPFVLGPQLCAAAADMPLTEDDVDLFGGPTARAALADLVSRGMLRRRAAGWYWTTRRRPNVDIRGAGGEPVRVVEADTGRLLGTVDPSAARSTVHPGALYLHQGASYVVEDLVVEDAAADPTDRADAEAVTTVRDPDPISGAVATVRAQETDWTTSARDVTEIRIVDTRESRRLGRGMLATGTVDVTSRVVGYLRREVATGRVLDERPLDLPVQRLRTVAVWYTVDAEDLAVADLDPVTVPGAAHAAEHAAIGLLPLFATCDRADLGGVSTADHPDTGNATVFVYDGHPGGAGFAHRGFEAADLWLGATRDAIASCECDRGCPSCVQSPKCGNGNEPLDKAGAVRLLGLLIGAA